MHVRSPSPEIHCPATCWDRYHCALPETSSPAGTGLAEVFCEPARCPHTHHGQGQPQPWISGQMSEAALCVGLWRERGWERGISSHAQGLFLTCPPHSPAPNTSLQFPYTLQLHQAPACGQGLSQRGAGGPSQSPRAYPRTQQPIHAPHPTARHCLAPDTQQGRLHFHLNTHTPTPG